MSDSHPQWGKQINDSEERHTKNKADVRATNVIPRVLHSRARKRGATGTDICSFHLLLQQGKTSTPMAENRVIIQTSCSLLQNFVRLTTL